jgi:hypothetical protein
MVCTGEYGDETLDNTKQCILSPVEELHWTVHQIIIKTVKHMRVQCPGNQTPAQAKVSKHMAM